MNFYARLSAVSDNALGRASDALACESGCSYCCYYKVEGSAAEIFRIAEYMKSNFKKEQIETILESARNNVSAFSGLTYEQKIQTNQKCPLLRDDVCAVYDVRPAKCRNHHSTDASLCKKTFDDPMGPDNLNGYIEDLKMSIEGASIGFEKAVSDKGYDQRAYDLNSALVEAFENPKSIKRYNKKKKAFLSALEADV